MIKVLVSIALACAASSVQTLDFSTFFGGEAAETAAGAALDADGNIYVVGQSRDLAPSPGSLGAVAGGSFNVFVLKLDPGATRVEYLAVFGGSATDSGTAIVVDAEGAAYVSGTTFSDDFPVTAGAAQTRFGGGTRDAYVAKISPDGSRFEYASYWGGAGFEDGAAVAVDPEGRAVLAGTSNSADFPTTSGAFLTSQPSAAGSAFAARFSPDGAGVEYATLIGGSGADQALAADLDAEGGVWLGGSTSSADFPVGPDAFQTELRDSADGFLVRLAPDGGALTAGTLLGGAVCAPGVGGARCDEIRSVRLDEEGVVAAGATISSDFPTTPDAFQTTFGGGTAFGDAFVAKFSRDLSTLLFSTYLGGRSEDRAEGVATDLAGNVLVVGFTGSPDFPREGDPPPGQSLDRGEAFVARLSADGSQLIRSFELGGSEGDRATALALNRRGAAVVVGETSSANFPVGPEAFQREFASLRTEGGDAFVAGFSFDVPPRFFAEGVVNAASFRGGTIAPGEIISVFGRAVGPDSPAGLRLTADGLVASELAGARLRIGGVPAPLIFTSAGQINAVVPYALAGASEATVRLEIDGLSSEEAVLSVAPTAPALFTLDGLGTGQAAALNEDGTLNGPANPAKRGSVVVLFGTGEGQTDPPGIDGKPATAPLPSPTAPLVVIIGGAGAPIDFKGGAPGFVAGLIQINARVPQAALGGDAVPVAFTAAGVRSPAGVTIAVE